MRICSEKKTFFRTNLMLNKFNVLNKLNRKISRTQKKYQVSVNLGLFPVSDKFYIFVYLVNNVYYYKHNKHNKINLQDQPLFVLYQVNK